MNHESRITNHESRITNDESRITNHVKKKDIKRDILVKRHFGKDILVKGHKGQRLSKRDIFVITHEEEWETEEGNECVQNKLTLY